MLFSPLTAPATINPATGTGYHVTSTGYGAFGTGTTGAASNSDFRRRVAENMLGALTSLDDRAVFLFGGVSGPSRPQALYFLDFDDPTRTNTRDFNGFRDNALPREGLTGPGDSGGPLILDQAFAKKVVIGVLSGGSTFFTGQTGGSYGTQSFYQPLFLYWDWIAANNPLRFATATSGNGNWEDGAKWLTELDPNYQILVNGALANGVPTNAGLGIGTGYNGFGEYCFQSGATNQCQDIATGTIRNNVPNNPSDGADLTDSSAIVAVTNTAESVTTASEGEVESGGRLDGSAATDSAQAGTGFATTATPAATLANGLPGATNFVPNNNDGVRATGVAARYYNVTLRNAGTITLNSAVTIDNFAITGASSRLNVASGASLSSLMEINQLTGTVQVDGTVSSLGDYFLMSGLLTGSGRINSPFLTSVLGGIAPGTIGTIGTLTQSGNTVLSSGSGLLIDIGPGNTSDRYSVITGAAGSGLANVGGTVSFTPVTGHTVRAGDVYTFLTAQGGVSGAFATPAALSAILTPKLVYSATSVQAQITAGLYASLTNTPVSNSYAWLLDRNRAVRSNYASMYDYLDLQNAATIRATLESWAPRAEVLKSSIGTTAIDNMNRFYRSRLGSMDVKNGLGGSVAVLGNPLQTASLASSNQMQAGQMLMNYGGPGQETAKLPETLSAFFAGGYLDGESDSMATAIPFGQIDQFDGYYLAAGIETELAENAGLGFGLSYTNMDGTTGGVAQEAGGELVQGTIYGKIQSQSGLTLDVQLSAALFKATTDRTVAVGPTSYRLQSKDDTLALSGEVGLSKMFDAGMLDIGPRVAMRFSRIDFTPTTESGGGPALAFDRGRFDSVQGLAGLTLSGGMKVRPYASAYYVHEIEDKPAAFGANFVSGVGLPAIFALGGDDHDWFEASAGIAFGSDKVEFALGADTTIGRDDVSNQSYRGSVTIRF